MFQKYRMTGDNADISLPMYNKNIEQIQFEKKKRKKKRIPLKENDILLPFAILFLWLILENH